MPSFHSCPISDPHSALVPSDQLSYRCSLMRIGIATLLWQFDLQFSIGVEDIITSLSPLHTFREVDSSTFLKLSHSALKSIENPRESAGFVSNMIGCKTCCVKAVVVSFRKTLMRWAFARPKLTTGSISTIYSVHTSISRNFTRTCSLPTLSARSADSLLYVQLGTTGLLYCIRFGK